MSDSLRQRQAAWGKVFIVVLLLLAVGATIYTATAAGRQQYCEQGETACA